MPDEDKTLSGLLVLDLRISTHSICSTAIHIKNNKNFGSYVRTIFFINCYYSKAKF